MSEGNILSDGKRQTRVISRAERNAAPGFERSAKTTRPLLRTGTAVTETAAVAAKRPVVVARPKAQVAQAAGLWNRYYPGFALLRIAAAVGVVQFHVGADNASAAVNAIRSLMLQQRVPTFLLIALYLAVAKQMADGGVSKFLRRLQHLLIPFLAWMVIYEGSRLALNAATGQWDRGFTRLLDLGTELLGGVWHLYFLVWLAAGTTVAFALTGILKRLMARSQWPAWICCGLVGVFTLAAHLVCESAGFADATLQIVSAADSRWTAQAATFAAGIARYSLMSLPYIAIALLFHAVRLIGWRIAESTIFALVLGGLWVNHSTSGFPATIPELAAVTGAAACLLVGVIVPSTFQLPTWVVSASKCSFGIFLCHSLVSNILETAYSKFTGVPRGSLNAATFVAFVFITLGVSWIATLQMNRFRLTRRILLGAAQ